MSRLTLLVFLFLFISSVACGADRPNIIVIFTDDHGWADLRCQSSLTDIKTPNLDAMGKEGVVCTAGYITAPQCVPSRAGLLTGRYQQRFGVRSNGLGPLPLTEKTIAARLQAAGYVTGMVGKWHLDPNHSDKNWYKANPQPSQKLLMKYNPINRGFDDVFYGSMYNCYVTYDLAGDDVRGKNPTPTDPGKKIKLSGYRLDNQTDAALAFLKRHKEGKKPFFLYLAYFAPHVPLEAPPKYLSRFPGEMPERRRVALAMLSAVDDGVGRIREQLRQYKMEKNTLIFFIGDNGAPLKMGMKDIPLTFKGGAWDGSRNDPWVGEKGMISEGGVRVPYVVTYPGAIPAGKVYKEPVSSLDVGATALALATDNIPEDLDGVNLLPYLTGEKKGEPHTALYWRFWAQAAVREGKWKYIQLPNQAPRLFDLTSEEHEKRNLAKEHPAVVTRLAKRLAAWQKELELKESGLNSQEVKFYEYYFPTKTSTDPALSPN